MKALARSYFWWPGLDKDIEAAVRACQPCQMTRPRPSPSPLHSWQWPIRPWERIHADYGDPVEGKMLLVVVDARSKWIEVGVGANSTALTTIYHFRRMFATHGIPRTIVTDNGPNFASEEFADFAVWNGIWLIRSAPYQPSTNGQAEKAVDIVKRGPLRQPKADPLEKALANLLLQYRVTPHSTTGVAPC